ncbi:MAG: AAA family ATPase [Flavobacteriaceae bacterium]|nr:AAA family ATPase [Flavobacteriaceae bacterium]
MKRYIITGAPGTGKTTLINALQKDGYLAFEEVSRRIILSEQKIGGNKTPWEDVIGFTNLVYQTTIEELKIPIHESAFVDRGLADNIAYLKMQEQRIPNELLNFEYLQHYHPKVFVLPPWCDIFEQDPQRLQTFEEATEIQEILISTYMELGFDLEIISKSNVKKRVEIIKNLI